MTNLNLIYSPKRLGMDQSKDDRSEYQRDFDRIIFSSAFRRLQNKTQVFPLPGSVFVHNRLTHSLEVASVGRSLGNLVGEFIASNFKNQLTEKSILFYQHNLYNVISSACLCHDIGNPAFGHSGEEAIASYFQKNEWDGAGNPTDFRKRFSAKEWQDFICFEGNANAIRILTQHQTGKSSSSLSLTFATMASIAKYPIESMARADEFIHRKKFGFFQSEKEHFKTIAENTQMIQEAESPLMYKRHPFVWLVEAADDICYNIIDLEDSHRLGIIDHDKCKDLLLNLIESLDPQVEKVTKRLASILDKNEKIAYLRAKSIANLTQATAKVYTEDFNAILSGDRNISLLNDVQSNHSTSTQEVLEKIAQFSTENIYNHHAVVEIENAGFHVMYELLAHFIEPILKDNRATYDKKAIKLMPNQFLYEDGSDYQKVLGVLDFVSGMTDNYATELYRKIKGIEIGMRR